MRPQRNPLPGQGERRQLSGVLLPGNHGGGRGAPQPAVRAIFIRCALGAAGYRRRHRSLPPRRSHPVRLRHVWAGSRGPGRERHHVPPALSDPRRRACPRIPDRHGHSLVPGQGRGATPRWGCGPRAFASSPAHGDSLGRHGAHRSAGVAHLPGRLGRDAGTHGPPVG